MKTLNFLDLFAGAGGLSEGFIQSGFNPIAHVEIDKAACYTLKTRMAYHWLKSQGKEFIYSDYLNQKITRDEFYLHIPSAILNSVINQEISTENYPEIRDKINKLRNGLNIDLIVGGPPCQAYSLVGRSRDSNKMIGDNRNYLYKFYAEFLKEFQPKYFVFENVVGLLSAKDTDGVSHFDKMQETFKNCGYSVEYKVVNSKDFGVLQSRRRVIIIGRNGVHSNFYPDFEKVIHNYTVNEVFKGLPKLKSGEGDLLYCKSGNVQNGWIVDSNIINNKLPITYHQARQHNLRDLEIYKIAVKSWNKNKRLNYQDLPSSLKTHNNEKSFIDRFKVIDGKGDASHTIVAHIAKDGHHFIHPDLEQNRSITPREAARLQSFPDDYFFESDSGKPARTSAFRQIGNAVPVLLAGEIAQKIKEGWNE